MVCRLPRAAPRSPEFRSGESEAGFSSTYFEVPIRERGAAYRVRVYAFDFVQSARIEST